MLEFSVGQVAYMPRLDGRSVERVTVERITASTDKTGDGGRYCYTIGAEWLVSYALSNGSAVHAGSLFADPASAFRHIAPAAV
jgi:hypothetical protein